MSKSHESPSDSRINKLIATGLGLAMAATALAGCGEKVSADNEPAPTETTQSTVEETKAPERTYSQEDYPAYTKIDIYGTYGAMELDIPNVDRFQESTDGINITSTDTFYDVVMKYNSQTPAKPGPGNGYQSNMRKFTSSEGLRYFYNVLATIYPDEPLYQLAKRGIEETNAGNITSQRAIDELYQYQLELNNRALDGDKEALEEIGRLAQHSLDVIGNLLADRISGNAGHPGNMSTDDHEAARNIINAIDSWTSEGDYTVGDSTRMISNNIKDKVRGEYSPEQLEDVATFWRNGNMNCKENTFLKGHLIDEQDSYTMLSTGTITKFSDYWKCEFKPDSKSDITIDESRLTFYYGVLNGKFASDKHL